MKTIDVEVAAENGEKRKAHLYVCSVCDESGWVIFRIDGHSHDHLQCLNCDTTFCINGECEKDMANA